MELAPIVLFCYNRPEHTSKTINALAKNDLAEESVLYIFCDGAKENATIADKEKIVAVRKIVAEEKRFKEIYIVNRDHNLGLANSIIAGVTEVVNKYGSIIVLEDDILCSPFFLRFMNEALIEYKNENKVLSIGACNYFVEGSRFPGSFFLPVADCWGWATCSERWSLFEPDSGILMDKISKHNGIAQFNLFGYYDFYGMLQLQNEGKVNSWAIRWQAVIYLKKMLTVYPNPSLTQHIASLDATHATMNVCPKLANSPIQLKKGPVLLNKNLFQRLIVAYYLQLEFNPFKKIVYKMYHLFKMNKMPVIKEYVDQINHS